ncbi:MAG TPA: hypothetical protein VE862_12140 [Candidatus Acidoferrum sp.]|nr:hypothetical protein [Candidatus Acidoferrum sp.]
MGSTTAPNPTISATKATAKAVFGDTDHSELFLALNWSPDEIDYKSFKRLTEPVRQIE